MCSVRQLFDRLTRVRHSTQTLYFEIFEGEYANRIMSHTSHWFGYVWIYDSVDVEQISLYIYIIHSTSSLCYGHAEPASVSSVRSVRRPSSEAEEIFGSPFSEALADPDPHQSLQSIIYEIIHQNRSGLESCPHGVKSERLLKVMILEISAMGRLKGYCGKKSCKHLKH